MTTLRDLAQAVVDAGARFRADRHDQEAYYALVDATRALGLRASEAAIEVAASVLAALDAADAQGYARAMGEVVERCEATPVEPAWTGHAEGWTDALDALSDWARERLPAASELAIPPTSSRQARHDAGNRSG